MANQIQTRVITILRADLGLYELRIIMKIVETVQPLFKGDSLSHIIRKGLSSDGINLNFSFPIKDLLNEDSHHYELIYNAAKRLAKKCVEYTDTKNKTKYYTPIISNIKQNERDGVIKFTAAEWLAKALVDVTFGCNMYNLRHALALKNPCAIRLYMLTCSSTQPIRYSILFLKSMLGVDGKYSQTRDFIKRCIDPAEKELENKGLNGFSYSKIKNGKAVVALLISPVKREQQTANQLAAQIGTGSLVPQALQQYLYNQCDITYKELSSHKVACHEFCKIPSWTDIIVHIVEGQRKKRAGKGYIFSAIKKEVEKFNIYKSLPSSPKL